MFDNNDSIEEQRRKHFENLNLEDTPSTPSYTYEPTPPPSSEVSVPKKNDKKPKTFLIALFGAIVGALIAIVVGILLLNYTNLIPIRTSYNSSGGTVVNFDGGDATSSVEAVAQVVPNSVVGVSCSVVTTGTNLFGQETQSQGTSIGSGFFVTEDGYIVTNQHVTTDSPQSISISTADNHEYEGKLIWSDSSLDLAIIKVDAHGVQPLTLGDSDNLSVGATVIAIGNPLGLNYSRTVTSGIISAIDRTLVNSQTGKITAEGLIQTDAAINQGNSGGPLVNVKGEVIGINTYKSSVAEGIGFAIPINLFKPIIAEVIESGNFEPRLIGVTGYDPEQAKYILNDQLKNFNEGFYIVSVTDGSAAQKAGLQEGDIIKTIDGKNINTLIQMRTILYNHKIGDKLKVTYQRGDQTIDTELTLEKSS